MAAARRRDSGNLSVMEAMIVGVIVISGTTAVLTMKEPVSSASNSRSQLQNAGLDVLAILSELPPDSSEYANALEEVVALALQGDRGPLEEKVGHYLPDGVLFEMFLENGQGGIVPVYSRNEEPPTEAVTSSILLDPHWSFMIMVPVVEQMSGVVPLNVMGSPVPPITNTLNITGLYVRNSYVDDSTEVFVKFPGNGYSRPFTIGAHGLRYTGAIAPEYPSALGYQPGYDVQYSNTSWSQYLTDSANLLQDAVSYSVTHNQNIPQPTANLYTVHPKYTLSSTISNALTSVTTEQGWRTGKSPPEYNATESAKLEWDLSSSLASLVAQSRTITIYTPAGGVATRDVSTNEVVSGSFTYEIPKDSLYGTYVAELKITGADVADPTKVYIVHQLTLFNVNPPSGFEFGAEHVPPVYRLVLNTWYGDWDGSGSPITSPGGNSGGTGGGGRGSTSLLKNTRAM